MSVGVPYRGILSTRGSAHRRLAHRDILESLFKESLHKHSKTRYCARNAATSALQSIQPSSETKAKWEDADLVCFDVDSTFCTDESIDEIAAFIGKGEMVAELTKKAMGGSMKFQDALKERLDCMNVSEKDLSKFRKQHPPSLSPGIVDLVTQLQIRGKEVALVSGGFRQIIEPIADSFGIPHSHVHANRLLFNKDGSYKGFDTEEYTSRTGGKAEAIKDMKYRYEYKTVVMVGDGSTDAEAKCEGGADMFICYGGVVLRENVALKADWVVMDLHDLVDAFYTE